METRDQLRKWYKNIPDLYTGAFRKKWVKALQRKGAMVAIAAKCQDCMCWQNTEIRECSIVTCPLYQYRPNTKMDTEIVTIVTELADSG